MTPQMDPQLDSEVNAGLTVRSLPAEEFYRLKDYGPFAEAGALPDPKYSIVVVLEDHGMICGCWMVRNMALLEGLFLSEAYRQRIPAAKQLLTGMIDVLTRQRVGQAMTLVLAPEIARLAVTAGFTLLPGQVYLLDRKVG